MAEGGGPGGKVIGKISIKVVPDTSKFADELKAKLKEIEDSLKIEIPVELNTKKAQAEGEALKKKLESNDIVMTVRTRTVGTSNVKKDVSGLGAPIILLGKSFDNLGLSVQRFGSRMVEIRRDITASLAASVRWTASLVKAAATSTALQAAWNGVSNGVTVLARQASRLNVLATMASDLAKSGRDFANFIRDDDAVTKKWYSSLVSVHNAIDTTKKSLNRFGVAALAIFDAQAWSNGFEHSLFSAYSALGKVESGFKRLKSIKISSVVDDVKNLGKEALSAGDRIAKGIGRGFTNTLKLGRNFTTSLGRTLKGGLRGAIDGAVIGSTRLLGSAISAIGDGFQNAGKFVSNFADQLGNIGRVAFIVIAVLALLAPALGLITAALAAIPAIVAAAGIGIAAIALGMDGIKAAAKAAQPAFDAFKKAISDTFEKQLTPVFKQIANVLLPAITDSFKNVAGAVSDVIGNLVNLLTTGDNLKLLNDIINQSAGFIRALSPFINSVTKTFLVLADVGLKSFSGLADGLTRWADAFGLMIKNAADTGVLTKALNGLGQVLTVVGDVFNRLFAAGLQAMIDTAGPFSALIKSIGDVFIALMPALTTISNLFSSVLAAALEALVPVIQALTPSFNLLGQLLGQLLVGALQALTPILVAAAQILGTVLLKALQAIQPILPPLITFMTTLGQSIGDFLVNALTLITPLLDLTAQFLTGILQAVTPLLPVLNQLATAVLKAMLDVLTPLMPQLMDLAKTVFPIITDVVVQLVPVIVQLVQAFLPLIPAIAQITVAIITLMIPIFQSLLKTVQEVWPSIQEVIRGVLEVISGLIRIVGDIIKGDWSDLWGAVKQVGEGLWVTLKGVFSTGINTVLSLLKNLPSGILQALGNLASTLFPSGKSLIQGFVSGITSAIGSAYNAVKGFLSTIRNLFPFSPAKEGPFSGRGYTTFSGRALATDFAKGISDKAPLAVKAVESMMSNAQAVSSSEFNAAITSDGFGGVGDQVSEALAGWTVEIDKNGIAKLVNKANISKARRG
jgi:phage-related protein